MNVERLTLSEWGESLPGSGTEPFHRPSVLRTLAEHMKGTLELYGGYKGDRPVALFPAFVRDQSIGRAILSPPPALGVPHLGPVLMQASPKRRKRERVNEQFTEELLDEFDVSSSLTLFRVLCSPAFADPRPFVWRDLDVETLFTYQVEVDDPPDEILTSFSGSLRREIRSLDDADVRIETGGVDAAEQVYDDQETRYAEQDESFPLSWQYVRDLLDALGDRFRVYLACGPDDEYLTGIVVVYGSERAYFWLGGARASYENNSVNSLLHWAIIEDAATDPDLDRITAYDLVGANTRRLCRYKAKFSPTLVPYYLVESSGRGMDAAKWAYQAING